MAEERVRNWSRKNKRRKRERAMTHRAYPVSFPLLAAFLRRETHAHFVWAIARILPVLAHSARARAFRLMNDAVMSHTSALVIGPTRDCQACVPPATDPLVLALAWQQSLNACACVGSSMHASSSAPLQSPISKQADRPCAGPSASPCLHLPHTAARPQSRAAPSCSPPPRAVLRSLPHGQGAVRPAAPLRTVRAAAARVRSSGRGAARSALAAAPYAAQP